MICHCLLYVSLFTVIFIYVQICVALLFFVHTKMRLPVQQTERYFYSNFAIHESRYLRQARPRRSRLLTCHIHRMLTTPSRDFQLFVFIIWNFSHLSIVLYNLFHRLSRAFRAGNGKTPLRHGVSRATSPQGEAWEKEAPLEGSCQRS